MDLGASVESIWKEQRSRFELDPKVTAPETFKMVGVLLKETNALFKYLRDVKSAVRRSRRQRSANAIWRSEVSFPLLNEPEVDAETHRQMKCLFIQVKQAQLSV